VELGSRLRNDLLHSGAGLGISLLRVGKDLAGLQELREQMSEYIGGTRGLEGRGLQ